MRAKRLSGGFDLWPKALMMPWVWLAGFMAPGAGLVILFVTLTPIRVGKGDIDLLRDLEMPAPTAHPVAYGILLFRPELKAE